MFIFESNIQQIKFIINYFYVLFILTFSWRLSYINYIFIQLRHRLLFYHFWRLRLITINFEHLLLIFVFEVETLIHNGSLIWFILMVFSSIDFYQRKLRILIIYLFRWIKTLLFIYHRFLPKLLYFIFIVIFCVQEILT